MKWGKVTHIGISKIFLQHVPRNREWSELHILQKSATNIRVAIICPTRDCSHSASHPWECGFNLFPCPFLDDFLFIYVTDQCSSPLSKLKLFTQDFIHLHKSLETSLGFSVILSSIRNWGEAALHFLRTYNFPHTKYNPRAIVSTVS